MHIKLLGVDSRIKTLFTQLKEQYMISQGWDEDITFLYGKSLCETQQVARQITSEKRGWNAFTQLCSQNGIAPGDLILAYSGRRCVGICEVPQEITFIHLTSDAKGNSVSYYKNGLFPARWVDRQDVFPAAFPPDTNNRHGVSGIENARFSQEILQQISTFWNEYKKKNNFDPNDFPQEIKIRLAQYQQSLPQRQKDAEKQFLRSKKMSYIQEYANRLKAAKNLVLTGAPGTGKTFLANKIAALITQSNSLQKTFETKRNLIDQTEIQQVLAQWKKYKEKILNNSLALSEYANIREGGDCLFSFLEYDTKIFGSTRSGSASYWGIYQEKGSQEAPLYRDGDSEKLDPAQAKEFLQKEILPVFQNLLRSSSAQEMTAYIDRLEQEKNAPIKIYQCLRKIAVLEYPSELIGIYKDEKLQQFCQSLQLPYQKDNFYANNQSLVNYLKKMLQKTTLEPADLCAWSETLWSCLENTKALSSYIAVTQFHPSYDYTDFIEGLRPCYTGADKKEISFQLKKGIFLEFCERAAQDPQNNYVFIIDEINRGELSKILGELFAAIDPGYRGADNALPLKTQYANLHTDTPEFADSPFKDFFYVPQNLYILGTMNDIDRSVESFDFALRRRFTWLEITADQQQEFILNELSDPQTAAAYMARLNEQISQTDGLSGAYHVGPAYFLKLADYQNDKQPYEKLWRYHLEPLLKEYLRGLPDNEEKLDALKNAFFSQTKQA